MPEPLDLTLLRSFVAVVELGSIQLAAVRVGRSQSAVSMQIKRLEEDVGCALFQRDGRNLRLNVAGDDLLLHARRLLRLSDEALASLRRPDTAGVVRFGLPEDYAEHLALPAIARFQEEFPLAEVELTFDSSPDLLRMLDVGQIDMALVTRTPNQPFAVLRREPFVWAAAPEHSIWLRDPIPVGVFEAGDIARRVALEALQAVDRPYRVVATTHSVLGLVAIAQAGLGVIGLVESSVPPNLVRLTEEDGLPPMPSFDLSLIPGPGEPAPVVRLLQEFLLRELRNDGGVGA